MEKRRLKPEEWAQVRRRWEGAAEEGFEWLAKEIGTAWGVAITRPALNYQAKTAVWTKGAPDPTPLQASKPASKASDSDASERPAKRQKLTQKTVKSAPPETPMPPRKAALSLVKAGDKPADPEPPKAPPKPEPQVNADYPEDQESQEPARTRARLVTEPRRMEDKPGRAVSLHLAEARKAGRPPEYIDAMCFVAHRHALLGATDLEMAQLFNVSEQTINNWKDQHPAFLESIKSGKADADSRVSQGLYMRATGYIATVEKPMSVPIGQGMSVVEIVQYNEYVAPDPKAAAYWLNNRRPADWKNNVVFTPAPPSSIADTKLLDEIYARKAAQARQLQAQVTNRMARLGLITAMAEAGQAQDVEPNPAQSEDVDG